MNNDELQLLLEDREGMKFNLNDSSNETTILKRTLYNHGIYNLSQFIDPRPRLDFDESNIDGNYNNEYNIKKFHSDLENGGYKYTILVDNDADGFASAAFLYAYLSHFTNKLEFMFSEGKTHGVNSEVLKQAIDDKVEYLLIPDSASNDYLRLKDLTRNNIQYLIIDHHDFNNEDLVINEFLPIISNQYSEGTDVNENFTGVGMVYMVAKKLDELFETDYADKYLYLFSLGQVADVSDVSDLEIRYLMLKGFDEINNSPLLRLNVDTEHISPHELSFSIIPKINAVCRTGSIDDKANLMKSLSESVSEDEKFELKTRKKSRVDGKFHQITKQVSYHELETRALNSLQAKQKRQVNNAMKKLVNIRQNDSFAVVVDDSNTIEHTEMGLLATKLCNKLQKPTLVLHPGNKPGQLSGSGRGFVKVMPDFKQFCLDSKKFSWCAGHGNAFGAAIKEDKLEELLSEATNSHNEIVYDVDCVYINDVPSMKEVKQFDEYRSLFGGKVKDPRLAFVSLYIPLGAINFRGNMLTFKKGGISFAMFTAPDSLKNEIESFDGTAKGITFDIYGSPSVNRFMQGEFPQVIMSDIKISDPVVNQPTVNIVNDLYDF